MKVKKLTIGQEVFVDNGDYYFQAVIVGKGRTADEVYLEFKPYGNRMYWEKKFVMTKEEVAANPKPVF